MHAAMTHAMTRAMPPARAARIERLLAAAAPGSTFARTTVAGEAVPLVRRAIAAGATRICVVSAILNAPDAAKACAEFKSRL